jgi:hypothetical protein
MACAEPRAVVTMEVFEAEDVIRPVWIVLEFLRAAVNRSPAVFVLQEYPTEPVGDLSAHLEQVHHLS